MDETMYILCISLGYIWHLNFLILDLSVAWPVFKSIGPKARGPARSPRVSGPNSPWPEKIPARGIPI